MFGDRLVRLKAYSLFFKSTTAPHLTAGLIKHPASPSSRLVLAYYPLYSGADENGRQMLAVEEAQDNGRNCQEYRNNTETIPMFIPLFDVVEYREIPKQNTGNRFPGVIPEITGKYCDCFRAAGILKEY